MEIIRKYWHWILAGGIFLCEAVVLLGCGENIYVGICDNLDLFITQLKMLGDSKAFFAHGQFMPVLGSIDRDYFPSEFSVYNLLYLILPDVYAYIAGYLLKLVLSVVSCILLAKLLLGQDGYKRFEKPVVLAATAFALLPVYPMYALCFASMPLILYLLVRIYRKPQWWLFAAVFLYPLVSYFTFFGAFLLGYILIAFVILWIRDRKAPLPLLGAFAALMAGFVCFEYRLFSVMFLSEETIRSTMVIADYDAAGLWRTFVEVFLHGTAHAKSMHTYFVLPVCILYFIWNTVQYVQGKKAGRFYTDVFNLTLLFILFNCLVYALYYWKPLRTFVEFVLPPLKGFQYGRTIFFNTFAWYFAFFIVLKELYQKKQLLCFMAGIAAIVVIGGTQCEYSDFYNTCYCNLYKLLKHTQVNQLNYGEFYGGTLIEEIKSDIGYMPEQGACAYGFHPAMLSYNGITTIDGYCGYYSQSYKEQFRKAIAPTLAQNENWRIYYDEWGCRVYLFSESGENSYDFGASSVAEPQKILIDSAALKALGCDYIFSRVEITNAAEMELTFVKEYNNGEVPYSVWLYALY